MFSSVSLPSCTGGEQQPSLCCAKGGKGLLGNSESRDKDNGYLLFGMLEGKKQSPASPSPLPKGRGPLPAPFGRGGTNKFINNSPKKNHPNIFSVFGWSFGGSTKIGKIILNIISYTFLVIIFYFFIWDLRLSDFIQIFIFSIFSFAISMFISDKFKFSNNKFIKILQKLVFTNIILALFGLIGYLLDINIFKLIFCDIDEEIGLVPSEHALQETQNSSSSEIDVQASPSLPHYSLPFGGRERQVWFVIKEKMLYI